MESATIRQFFPQLPELDLQEKIAEFGTQVDFNPGETIIDYGQYIRFVPMVMQGSIKVMREDEEGNELILYYLNPGETCAVSLTCCMANKKSTIRAVAEDDVSIIAIPIKYMDEWTRDHPSWKNFVMNTYQTRFDEMLNTLDQIAFKRMDERLVKYLQDKAEVLKSQTINISHQDIAKELNTSREVVSRLLKKLEHMGSVKLGRNKIEVLDLD
jgi:CRP/FNR family transcriptional regulator